MITTKMVCLSISFKWQNQFSLCINAFKRKKSKLHHSTNQDAITVILWTTLLRWFNQKHERKYHRMRYTSVKWIQIWSILHRFQQLWSVQVLFSFFTRRFYFGAWTDELCMCVRFTPSVNNSILCKLKCFIVYNHWLATTILKGWSHFHFV